MHDNLIEILRVEWPHLLEIYSAHKTDPSYGTIKNYIRWSEKDPKINVKIYALGNGWKNNGTFAIIDYDEIPNCKMCSTLSNDLSGLTKLLNCLRSNSASVWSCIPERILPAVQKHFNFVGIKNFEYDCTIWYHIEKEKALKFKIGPPIGITLSPLHLSHAIQINDIWPYRSPHSITYIESLIRMNENIGAFNQQGMLVAWCLRLPVGSLGVLHVIDSNKRQGLGSLLVRYMSRNIAAKNEEVTSPVMMENVASRAMFEKLGFIGIDKSYWLLKPEQ